MNQNQNYGIAESSNRTDIIVENFAEYVANANVDLTTQTGIYDLMTEESEWQAFKHQLMCGQSGRTPFTEDKRILDNVSKVLNHSRQMTLMEDFAGNSPNGTGGAPGVNSAVSGWAVVLNPILMDIYAEPSLNEVSVLHTTDKPIYTWERQWLMSHQYNTDGTFEEHRFPDNRRLIRGKDDSISIVTGENNMYTMANIGAGEPITNKTHALNRSRTYIFEITVTDNHNTGNVPYGDATVNNHVIECNVTANDRMQFTPYNVTFKAGANSDGDTINCKIRAMVDWDSGVIDLQASFKNLDNPNSAGDGLKYEILGGKVKTRFMAKRDDRGRVMVSLKRTNRDVFVDILEDFKIEEFIEAQQDWSALYDVNMLKTFMLAIKKQIQYNKDMDIADKLRSYEPIMRDYKHYSICDMNKFKSNGGIYTPENQRSVINGIISHITYLNGTIYDNFHAYPNVLIAGRGAGNMLAMLRDTVYNTKDITSGGSLGLSATNMTMFNSQKLIISNAVADNRIYSLYRPAGTDTAHSSLVDVVHRPIYVAESPDRTVKETYIRSRTLIEVVRDDSFGYIELQNFEDLMPTNNVL